MPMVRISPAMPGRVNAAPEYAMQPEQQQEVRHDRDEGVDPGPVVVEEHEGGDQGEAGKRRHHAGVDRRGSE